MGIGEENWRTLIMLMLEKEEKKFHVPFICDEIFPLFIFIFCNKIKKKFSQMT